MFVFYTGRAGDPPGDVILCPEPDLFSAAKFCESFAGLCFNRTRTLRRAHRLVRDVGLNGEVDTRNADDMATAAELVKEVYRAETNA